jgi:hypothetical protein
MKIGIAKKIVCEEEAGKVERYSYPMQAPFKLVDDQSNIREIVEKHPYKKDKNNA